MKEHCWHEKGSHGHHGIQCCTCGLRWWEGIIIEARGHGRFAPATTPLPRPNKECPGPPVTPGKGGRKAIAEDVDFTVPTSAPSASGAHNQKER
jgi:hypothetical protein